MVSSLVPQFVCWIAGEVFISWKWVYDTLSGLKAQWLSKSLFCCHIKQIEEEKKEGKNWKGHFA